MRTRLSLSALEDRITPATVTWTGLGANDLWSNAANWDAGLPLAGDIVAIPSTTESASVIFDTSVLGTGISVASLTSDEPFVLSGDTLTVTGNVQMQNSNSLTLSGGTLSGATVLDGSTITATSSAARCRAASPSTAPST